MTKNRYFEQLPPRFKTDDNRRMSSVSDDIMFEPEDFGPVEGQVGDVADVSDAELAREPLVAESDAERARYQLSVAVVSGEAGKVDSGAFYTDLLNRIHANGGLIDDHQRLFETPWYAWTPPIDNDRWTNFHKYRWLGQGNASLQGEYVTKDQAGQRSVFFRADGPTTFTKVTVAVGTQAHGSFPAGTVVGQLREDSTTANRIVYKWDGAAWTQLEWYPVASVPESTALPVGTHFYVARWGYDFNRIVVHEYSGTGGRWVPRLPVVASALPSSASVGTMWEDCTSPPNRIIRKRTELGWVALTTWFQAATIAGAGVGTHGDAKYVAVDVASVTDGWSSANWWRHVDDLSPHDKSNLPFGTAAIRPILQIWSEVEAFPGSTRTARHVLPKFKLYGYSRSEDDIVAVGATGLENDDFAGCTVVRYKQGAGSDDPVLGFPASFDTNAEFKFELTIETDEVEANGEPLEGYRFYKDANTGLCRSVWTKSSTATVQTEYGDGTWEMPVGLTNNADHDIPSEFTRTDTLRHFAAVIAAGSAPGDEPTGSNGWRWSFQDPTAGALSIDPEASLLRPMSLLLDPKLDFADATRAVGQETSRFVRRFVRVLNQLWNTGDYSSPLDELTVTVSALVDEVLTQVLVAKQPEGPYWLSDMGTYVDSATGETKPIVVPSSTARTGATPAYAPRIIALGGSDWILCHDGRLMASFGDERDLVVLELENRFYAQVPTIRKTETAIFSAVANKATWETRRYVGNRQPTNSLGIYEVVPDAFDEPDPSEIGTTVYSEEHSSYAVWGGETWSMFPAAAGDVFAGISPGEYHAFNGFELVDVDYFPRPVEFDYSLNEAETIIRREFERWAIANAKDSAVHDDYDAGDPFTWNYSIAGVEGNWWAIYRRIYGTARPHSAPWECVGFSVEPTWWRTTFVPSSTAADGSPRYASGHAMWAAIKSGGSLANTLESWQVLASDAPTPVDGSGELVAPITCAAVPAGSIPEIRKSDRWRYGDGGPVEQEFWTTAEGRAAEAILAYLTKPSKFLEALWSDYVIPIGAGDQAILGGIQVVNVETLKRSGIAEIPVHLALDEDGEPKQNPGVNAWVSDRIVALGGSPEAEFGAHVQTARCELAWRTGGFVVGDSVSVLTTGGIRIPDDDLNIAVHHSVAKVSRFHSGVIVSREPDATYRVFGYDSANPKFTIIRGSKPIFAGQVEIREEFQATGQSTFTLSNFSFSGAETAKLSVIVDGQKMDDRFVVKTAPNSVELLSTPASGSTVVIALLTTQTNAITRVRQFEVNERSFFYYPASSGETLEVQYGTALASPQDVVEFLYDHGRWMAAQGWKYGREDDPDLPKNDWLDVAKRFANWVSTDGRRAGDVFADVAGGVELKLELEFGQTADLETVTSGSYPIVDLGGLPISPSETTVSRIVGELTVTSPDREIFGLRVFERTSEHVVFISPRTRFGDLVYDPVLGVRHRRLIVRAVRSNGWAGRMEAPGYLVYGDKLLPSLEKQANDFVRAYDYVRPINDSVRLEQAWNLYGWSDPQHLVDLGASLSSRIAFHRGHIAHKGTVASFAAFVRGTLSGPGSASVSEAWAWLLSDFGALEHRTRVRFRIVERDVKSAVQTVTFVDEASGTDGAIEVLPFDRESPAADTRWIVPPMKTENFEFPINADKTPISDKFSYRMRIVGDTQEAGVQDVAFHWDPAAGLHEPGAYSQVSYFSPTDPARYTDGAHADEAVGHEWGRDQVGRLWLDTSQLVYSDYRNAATPGKVAADWGKLEYVTVVSQQLSAVGYELTTATPHGLANGQRVFAKLKDGRQLFAYVFAVTDADTVILTLSSGEDAEDIGLNATFNEAVVSEIYTSDVKLYEWIESIEPPTMHDEVESTPFENDDPSWVTRVDSKQNRTFFYFWVRGSVVASGGRKEPAVVLEDKLRNPTSYEMSWFAPTTKTSFIFSGRNYRIDERSAIELAIDGNDVDFHQEWQIINEGETVDRTPPDISSALISSMLGTDENGGDVPWAGYTASEKYGVGRQKTVFRDAAAGKASLISSANRAFSRMRVADLSEFADAFPDDGEDVWWSRTDWRREDMEGIEVTQVAKDATERDEIKLPRENDTVRVVTAVPNPAGGPNTWALYARESGEWVEFGAGNATVQITDAIFDLADARVRILAMLSTLDAEVENDIVFGVLYEMVSQHESCNWFFKTSLVDLEHTVHVSQPSFKPRDELPMLLSALDASKPFHTKVRDISTTVVTDVDDASPEVIDTYQTKTSAFIDRVACNFFDESAWNSDAWNAQPWDSEPWHHSDLGRAQWIEVATFERAAGTRTYSVGGVRPNHSVRLAASIGEVEHVVPSYTYILSSGGTLTVTFGGVPGAGIVFSVQQARGVVYGPEPEMPDPDFDPIESTQRHAAARVAPYVSGAAQGDDRELENEDSVQELGCSSLDDPLGGGPGERVKSEWYEQSLLKVTTDPTPAWAGWNTQPWNAQPWDGYYDVAPGEFFVAFGTDRFAASGFTETFGTSETMTMDAGDAAAMAIAASGGERYRIGRIEVDRGRGNGFEPLEAGTDYEFVTPHSVRFPQVAEVILTGDGPEYQAPWPIASARLGSTALVEGVDYDLNVDADVITLSVPNTDNILVVRKALPSDEGNDIKIVYSGFELLSDRGRASPRLQNQVQGLASWDTSNLTAVQDVAGPVAMANSENQGWTITDASAPAVGVMSNTMLASVPASCLRSLSFYVKKSAADAHKFSAYLKYTGSVAPVTGRIVLNTDDGEITASSSVELAKVHDAGDFWRVFMLVRNDAGTNFDLEVGFSPAFNTNGSITPLVGATGSKVVAYCWVTDSAYDDVAYCEGVFDESYDVSITMDGKLAMIDAGAQEEATVGVVYHNPIEIYPRPTALVAGAALEIDEIADDKDTYFAAPGFDEAIDGITIIDMSDRNVYVRDGASWDLVGPIVQDRTYFSKRSLVGKRWDGAAWQTTFDDLDSTAQPFFHYGTGYGVAGSMILGRKTGAFYSDSGSGAAWGAANGSLPIGFAESSSSLALWASARNAFEKQIKLTNLLYYTDGSQFWDEAGTGTVTLGQADPNGGTSAVKLEDTSAANTFEWSQTIGAFRGLMSAVIFVKKRTAITHQLHFGVDLTGGSPAALVQVTVDAVAGSYDTGTAQNTLAAYTSVRSYDADWWKVTVGFANDAGNGSAKFFVRPAANATGSATAADATTGFHTVFSPIMAYGMWDSPNYPTPFVAGLIQDPVTFEVPVADAGRIAELPNLGIATGLVSWPSNTRPILQHSGDWEDAYVQFASSRKDSLAVQDDDNSLINLWAGGGYVAASFWVNSIAVANSIVDKRGAGTGWSLGVDSTGHVVFKVDFSGTDGVWTSSAAIAANAYLLVEVQYNSSSVGNDPTVRVDGAVVTMTETSTPVGTAVDDSQRILVVGAIQGATFDGRFRELVIITEPLTAAQRADAYASILERWS